MVNEIGCTSSIEVAYSAQSIVLQVVARRLSTRAFDHCFPFEVVFPDT